MGGFFGAVSRRDCVLDIFFGADYHSHLGTRRGGMVIYDQERGFQRQIHNIENTPFRTKFEKDIEAFTSFRLAPSRGRTMAISRHRTLCKLSTSLNVSCRGCLSRLDRVLGSIPALRAKAF